MRTRDKQRVCQRWADGETAEALGLELWRQGKVGGRAVSVRLFVEALIREAMNGAPWWPPKGKK